VPIVHGHGGNTRRDGRRLAIERRPRAESAPNVREGKGETPNELDRNG